MAARRGVNGLLETALSRPIGSRWPQLMVVAALLAVGAAVLVWLEVVGPAAGSTARGPVAIRTELTRRMQTVLERMPAEQHHGHAGQLANGAGKMVCGARVYGYEPESAGTVDEVVTVYGFHMCGLVEPGRTWDWSMKLVGPLVMHLDAIPPSVQVAESAAGVSYRDRVRQLIPARYQKMAFEQALTPEALAELRRRYESAVGAA